MDDLISRQFAINTIRINKTRNRAKNVILAADEDEIIRWLKTLPSAQAERKTGRWIIIKKGEKGYSAGSFRCSVCGEPDRCWVVPTRYCPNCGAKMEVTEDEQTK